jgi:integrase
MEWVKTKYPGIRYRLHSTRKHGVQADKYYVLTYKHDRKTRSEALGWASEGMTLDRAVEAMAEIKSNRRTGSGPDTLTEKRRLAHEAKQAAESERLRIQAEKASTEKAAAEKLRLESETVFDAVTKKYSESNSHKKSLHDEETLIRLWVQPVIGSNRLQEVTPFDIERIKRNMLKAGRSARTVQYTFAVIRQIYNYARHRNIFNGESPTKGVNVPKFDNKRMRFLSPAEADSLLTEIKKKSLTTYRISLLSLYSGMRLGEICQLTWSCIDIPNRQITIFDPKNSKTRVAFMADAVCSMFSEMTTIELDELVFPSKAKNKIIFISKTFNRAVDELKLNAGITDRRMKVVFHTLRHSCASQLAMSGADLPTIQAVLGHKSLAMTERYSHLSNQHIKNAIDRLQEALNPEKAAKVIPLTGRSG